MLTGILVVEAIGRLMNPSPVDGFIMFIVATLGLLVNLAMMKILHQDVGGGGSLHGHSHAGGGGTVTVAVAVALALATLRISMSAQPTSTS